MTTQFEEKIKQCMAQASDDELAETYDDATSNSFRLTTIGELALSELGSRHPHRYSEFVKAKAASLETGSEFPSARKFFL